MKRPKTSMKMSMAYDKEFELKNYRIIPVNINVKGFMLTEDASRIFDQIRKSVECSDQLLEKPNENELKPIDGQYAWVAIDNCEKLEMARYDKFTNSWLDFTDNPGVFEVNRVRVHQLLKPPKL